MNSKFDINQHKDRLTDQATWNQVVGLGKKFSYNVKTKKSDYQKRSQIVGCLWSERQEGKLSFADCNEMFSSKTFPAKYTKKIKEYTAQAKLVEKS